MDHAHHSCAHNALKFCGHCNAVWCQACKVEWRQYPVWNYTYTSYPAQQYLGLGIGGVSSGTTGGAYSGSLGTNTANAGLPVACAHGEN